MIKTRIIGTNYTNLEHENKHEFHELKMFTNKDFKLMKVC